MLKFHSVKDGDLPKLGTLVLVTCFDEDELCLAKLTFSEMFRGVEGYYNWLVQPFCGSNFWTKTGIKTWAYISDCVEPAELPPTIGLNFQIQYRDNKTGLWVNIPHKDITTRNEAEKAIIHLKNGIAFSDVELKIQKKYSIKNMSDYE